MVMSKTVSVEQKAREVEFQTEPLTDWAKEPSVQDLKDDLRMTDDSHNTQVSKIRKWKDLRNVEGEAKPKTVKNRSSVQPKLIRRQQEWRYSAMSEPFLSAENIFNCKPRTFEDKEGAEQHGVLLKYQFDTKINKVAFIDEYTRTCTDEGTVVVRPGWKRQTKMIDVEVPVWGYFVVEDEQQMQQLEQALEIYNRDPRGFEDLPDELKAAAEYTMETGQYVVAEIVGTEVVQEEKVVVNEPTLDILDYENVFIDPNAKGDIDKANFAVISFETSKAEMLKDGRYTNLDKVNWSSESPLNNPQHATESDGAVQFKDELRRVIVAYEYWGFYDIYDTGELVPIVATWVGNTMVRMELNPFPDAAIPLVIVPYMPISKSITGEPDAELLEENQAILGALTRGMIDLMGRSANGQTGFAKSMLDPLNKRKYDRGEDYEYNPGVNPDAMMYQHKYPEIPNSALTMLSMQNQEAEAMSGVKSFSGGLSGEAYGQVASGIRGLLDAAAKREMSILRRLAWGMEKIGRKMAAMNAAFLSDEEIIRVTNERFVKITRDDLKAEFDLEVDISTAEIEEAKAQDLGFMLQTLGNSIPFDLTKIILVQIAKLKRMPVLAKMLEEYQPAPDPLEDKRKELEIAELEAKIERIRSQSMLDQAQARAKASEADLKDLDFLETETGTKHAREMEKSQTQAESNQLLEMTKGILAPGDKKPSDSSLIRAARLHDMAKATV